MLDQQILRNNIDILKENLERRGLNIDIDFLVQQDEKKRAIKFEAEQAKSEQNNIGKKISQADGAEKEELLKKATILSESVKLLNEKYETEEKFRCRCRRHEVKDCLCSFRTCVGDCYNFVSC